MRRERGIAADHPNTVKGNAQHVRHHLDERSLMALTLGSDAEGVGDGPGRNRHARRDRNSQPYPGQFNLGGKAHTDPPPCGTCLRTPLGGRIST